MNLPASSVDLKRPQVTVKTVNKRLNHLCCYTEIRLTRNPGCQELPAIYASNTTPKVDYISVYKIAVGFIVNF